MSGSLFPVPLIAEPCRRIAGDRGAVAEPGSVECKIGKFALARTTVVQILEADGVTKAHEIHVHVAREQHSSRTPQ